MWYSPAVYHCSTVDTVDGKSRGTDFLQMSNDMMERMDRIDKITLNLRWLEI